MSHVMLPASSMSPFSIEVASIRTLQITVSYGVVGRSRSQFGRAVGVGKCVTVVTGGCPFLSFSATTFGMDNAANRAMARKHSTGDSIVYSTVIQPVRAVESANCHICAREKANEVATCLADIENTCTYRFRCFRKLNRRNPHNVTPSRAL